MSCNNFGDFKVCIKCITFNHAPYIVDCMNGFSMQQTKFPYVCCFLDDSSTDGEPEVIKHYLVKNFDLDNKSVIRNEETDDYILTFVQHKTNKNCFFAVFFLKYNHYSIRKSNVGYIAEWKKNAKYIAFCEGDDYWTDPLKLQKQFDFMEEHPECSLCFHANENLYPSGEIKIHKPKAIKRFYNIEDIIPYNGGFMATNAMFYISKLLKNDEIPDFWKNCPIGDLPAVLFLASQGLVGYIDEIMSVHRVFVPGSWTVNHQNIDKRRKHYAAIIKMYDEYDAFTEYKYHDMIRKRKINNKKNMIRKEIAFFLGNIWKKLKD